MSFTPMLPVSGYSGWRFMQRTMEVQKQAFTASPVISRDIDYFRKNIAKVSTAEELVSDRRLLKVALGAYGLDDDLNNKFFIQKILSDGTQDRKALANRLADSRYASFSKSFGLTENGFPGTRGPGFADKIIARYESKQFDIAVGEVDGNMRLALNLESGLKDIMAEAGTDSAQWFRMMGTAPVRKVFETALGFSSSFGAIDLDQQHKQFKERARSVFGTDSMKELSSPENREKMVRLFLTRASIASFNPSTSSAQTALTLLSSL